jgi:hypothetical protein
VPAGFWRAEQNWIEAVLHNTLANHFRSEGFRRRCAAHGADPNVYYRLTDAADRRGIAAEGHAWPARGSA